MPEQGCKWLVSCVSVVHELSKNKPHYERNAYIVGKVIVKKAINPLKHRGCFGTTKFNIKKSTFSPQSEIVCCAEFSENNSENLHTQH